jgi:hypothetical protein
MGCSSADGSSATGSSASTIVLTCMDYRIQSTVASYMDAQGMRGRYDLCAIPGANTTLCVDCDTLEDKSVVQMAMGWRDAIRNTVAAAVALHGVTNLWVFSHRDCGACKMMGVVGNGSSDDEERTVHSKMACNVKSQFGGLHTETFYVTGAALDSVDRL